MKIVKVLFVFALVSMMAVSCKETKKEDVQDDDAVEMTEEGTDSSGMEATDEEAASTESTAPAESDTPAKSATPAASAAAAEASSEPVAEEIETSSKDFEEFVVPEGVIAEELADTPVVYPGCTGSVEEIRACNKKSFIAFLKGEFNTDLATSLGLKEGNNEIKSIVHVDEAGKISALKIKASHKVLEAEMQRVIDMVPTVVPATKGGNAVPVTFLLPINFKVKS